MSSYDPGKPNERIAAEQMLYSIGEVAVMVGLSRHTIRAWERRHRLQPKRTASGQRRYTADDVAMLVHVKHAVTQHRLSLKVALGSAQGEFSVPAVQASAPPGLWRSAVDLLPEMILILDVDGVIRAANRVASSTLGSPADDLAGRRLADLLARGSGDADVRTLLQHAHVRRTSFEAALLTASGRQEWEFDCRPFSTEGTPHLAVIARMVSDRGRVVADLHDETKEAVLLGDITVNLEAHVRDCAACADVAAWRSALLKVGDRAYPPPMDLADRILGRLQTAMMNEGWVDPKP